MTRIVQNDTTRRIGILVSMVSQSPCSGVKMESVKLLLRKARDLCKARRIDIDPLLSTPGRQDGISTSHWALAIINLFH